MTTWEAFARDLEKAWMHTDWLAAVDVPDFSDWKSVILDSSRGADIENVDLSSGHARWDVYRRMMDSPVEWGRLMEIVGLEPDPSIAASVVLEMLERVPAVERILWVDKMTAREKHSFVVLRMREIRILEAVSGELVRECSFGARQVSEWSDWLQRRASKESKSPEVLERLSQSGRTRRVRHLAAERLRFLRRTS